MKRASILLTFLIALGVGCAEAPEFFSFCDDTSNDFVETIPLGRAQAALRVVQLSLNCISSVFSREPSPCGSSYHACQFLQCSRSGQELQLLLSIHRK
jgi:hypothetical protein